MDREMEAPCERCGVRPGAYHLILSAHTFRYPGCYEPIEKWLCEKCIQEVVEATGEALKNPCSPPITQEVDRLAAWVVAELPSDLRRDPLEEEAVSDYAIRILKVLMAEIERLVSEITGLIGECDSADCLFSR